MWVRRLKETIAILSVGDGVIALLAPREHSLLWETGPESVRKLVRFFADNPSYLRIIGATQIAFGAWYALRQYRED
ncbi:MAG TPA: hypothetical protein VNA27_14970 [Rubrobacteraceae bacterium]|jgi:hypothetical protein|nr:hypothetical protein [Rubrobacteraceae bacterium]HZG62807.1 hypothetical protein [Rubrobacteraceae bacterium]